MLTKRKLQFKIDALEKTILENERLLHDLAGTLDGLSEALVVIGKMVDGLEALRTSPSPPAATTRTAP